MNTFSELTWNVESECWSGKVTIGDDTFEALIDFDATCPNGADRERGLDAATLLLQQLTPDWEKQCRCDAAAEITSAAHSQSDEPFPQSLVNELLSDLKLVALEFTYSSDESYTMGLLGYVSPTCLPNMRVQITFNSELSIDEIMVIE